MDLYEQPSGLYLPKEAPKSVPKVKFFMFTCKYESNLDSALDHIYKAGATYIQTLNVSHIGDWDKYIILYAHTEELDIEELC